jgi:hypothetical protein
MQRVKLMTLKSAQTLMEAMRIYHNYIKPHQGLDGKTPAEASGIRIEGQNKWQRLIQNAVASNNES